MTITENTFNIYIEDYIIPKETNKENLKKREKLIWEMYGRWCVENPDKKMAKKYVLYHSNRKGIKKHGLTSSISLL